MSATSPMSPLRRSLLSLLLAATGLGVVPTPGAADPLPAAPAPGGAAPVVTLITGDEVTVHTIGGRPVPSVDPGEGRDGIGFRVRRKGDSLYVVPADAAGLVGGGTLDARLFDVAALLQDGYGDADRQEIPVIVQDEAGRRRVARPAMQSAGGRATALPAARATGVRQPKSTTGDFWAVVTEDHGGLAEGIGRVWLDGTRGLGLDVSVPQIGAPAAWSAGHTGEGVTVAVLDSGVDDRHPDLAGRVVGRRDFTGEGDGDQVGHGTHVAAIAAGRRGVAPGAELLDAKVCTAEGCPESAVLAGMQWAVESRARVVNLSLGAPDTPDLDPVEAAVNDLSAQHGTLFVVSAGNNGTSREALESPASADAALAVGAVDDTDRVPEFSSRGPRHHDQAVKPDISAPAVDIVAARPGEGHASASGTSAAAPHVAGAAALLAQQHPTWTARQLKAHLMGAAVPAPDVDAQGAGRVDVARAVAQPVHAEPASLSFGVQPWPHDDDEPRTETLTYTNAGTTPITLTLNIAATDPAGDSAPDGMVSLGRTTLTVPAGTTADVPVRLDTTRRGPDGGYTGRVTATAAGVSVTTALAAVKERESYDLTVVVRDLDGGRPTHFLAQVGAIDETFWHTGSSDRFTVRVRRGRYVAHADLFADPSDPAAPGALLFQPLVDVTADTTVELDGQQARPISVDLGRDDIEEVRSDLYLERTMTTGEPFFIAWIGGAVGARTAHFGPEVGDELRMGVHGAWTGEDGQRAYHLAWFGRGRVMTGLDERVDEGRLATIRAEYRRAGDDPAAWILRSARPADGTPMYMVLEQPVAAPRHRLELVNTDNGVTWSTSFVPGGGLPGFQSIDHRAYEPDRTYQITWNAAVRGPAVSSPPAADDHVADCPQHAERRGDVISVAVPTLTDADGHRGCTLDATATTRLWLGRRVLGETDLPGQGEFTVPAAPETYRLETTTDQPDQGLSTRVAVAWTFRSGHIEDDGAAELPLMAVRYRPTLDDRNRAIPGRPMLVPVWVDRIGPVGNAAPPVIHASFDDGATWVPVPVFRLLSHHLVVYVPHPTHGRFVSLRATAHDDRGNTVDQTIIRAYELGR